MIIGTRASKLAMAQTQIVADMLARHTSRGIKIMPITTLGDRRQDVPLEKIGGKGLFIKELEEALLDGRIDMAVHSLKDVPAQLPPGLDLGAFPAREDCRDVLVTKTGAQLHELPSGARVGTGSARRQIQLLALRPDICIVPIRGNIVTRLERVGQDLDGIVLAAAGVRRLGLEHMITQTFDIDQITPAVGQGALCVEYALHNNEAGRLLQKIDDADIRRMVQIERAYLDEIGGSCFLPLGAHVFRRQGGLYITAMYCDKGLVRKTVPCHSERDGTMLARYVVSAEANLSRTDEK